MEEFYLKISSLLSMALCGIPFAVCGDTASYAPPPSPLNLQVPPGFEISIYAKLPGSKNGFATGPRMMALGPSGELYVTTGRYDSIYKIIDHDQDGSSDNQEVWLNNLNIPHGIDYFEDYLYIANQDEIIKISIKNPKKKITLVKNLATGHHSTKNIKIGPDEHLYINLGSTCNVCIEEDPTRATIERYTLNGKSAGSIKTVGRHKPIATWARGLRNSQGFDWHPVTQEMYATNNGSDMRSNLKNGPIDDELPPEHLNIINPGKHYGWPYCWGNKVPDPNFDQPQGFCKKSTPPSITFRAHSTPIGITFLNKTNFPTKYKSDAIIALHGSWNRKNPTGYKLVRVKFKNNKPSSVEDFVTGWLTGKTAWGRPTGIIQRPNGGLFISDDRSGYIYNLSYTGETKK